MDVIIIIRAYKMLLGKTKKIDNKVRVQLHCATTPTNNKSFHYFTYIVAYYIVFMIDNLYSWTIYKVFRTKRFYLFFFIFLKLYSMHINLNI